MRSSSVPKQPVQNLPCSLDSGKVHLRSDPSGFSHCLCMDCVRNLRDHSSDAPFRCPDCRAGFEQVVLEQKSYALANIAEEFRLNKRRRAKDAERVYCDCCPEKTTPAVKTCLKCELSLCKEHLKDHLELRVFTGHPLVQPLSDLLERKCPQHKDEGLRYYCSSSRRYICSICNLESKQLSVASEVSVVLRRQLTEYMDQHFKMLREQIIESTNTVNNHRDRERGMPADSRLNGVTVVLLLLWFIVLYYAYNYSVENQTLVEALEKQQSRVHHTEGIMLDLDSSSCLLRVSADNQTAERVKSPLDYPNSDSRFDEAPQVLSTPCFSSGAHVWEVEAEGCWDIAVSYKSIPRKSKGSSAFGHNAESWSLTHSGEGWLFVCHNKQKTTLSGMLQSRRISVEVNVEEGRITFSSMDPVKTLLHQFRAELTEPVCLGLGLHHLDPPSRASIVTAS
ncbi:E3 ubiquitin-protein ligase TRIM11 [Austrofundulus limnaeus]|uniref:E3 ubiquitin-protein ligase TRIM11 n=1 Tax=Austrofundulus limnaeus TaxID=52670 RepID=A0A2I4B9L5_AUSLI|nr:PREDICTED: E3 ubiquitin-protein ligase TRIM11-like [Austrofundulus limnaeus]